MPRASRRSLWVIAAAGFLAAAVDSAAAQDRGCGPGGAEYNRIRQELARAQAEARGAGCIRGFIIFFPPHPACGMIMAQMNRLQYQLQHAARAGGGAERVTNWGAPARDCRGSGGRSARVVCVRFCDGYYFPVNHSVKKQNLPKDEQKCLSQYPPGQAGLFIDRSGGEDIGAMKSLDGKTRYRDQPYAFAFQRFHNPTCPRPGAHLAAAVRNRPDGISAAASRPATPVPSAALSVLSLNGAAKAPPPSAVRLVGPPYAYFFPERGDEGRIIAADLTTAAPVSH